MEEKSLFIWLLEYGEKNAGSRTSFSAMIESSVEEGITYGMSDPKADTLRSLFIECFDTPQGIKNRVHKLSETQNYSLQSEYYFRLLEFRELQLAREAANRAEENAKIAHENAALSLRQAGRAFWFSVVAVLISVLATSLATFIQLKTSITLDSTQLISLKDSIQQQTTVKLDEAQLEVLRQTIERNHSVTPEEVGSGSELQ